MAITSSAPPMPCGKPWLPRSASVPVSVIVCTGLVRRRQPFCGPSVSKRLRQREARAPADQGRALAPLGVVEEVQRAEDVVGAPAAPVGDSASPPRRWRPRGRCGRGGRGARARHPTVVQPTRVREDEMSDDGHHRRRYRGRREPRQPGPQPAGLPRRPAPGAQRHPGRGADGAQPAGAVGVAGPAAPALRRRAAHPGRQRVPADAAGGAAAGPGPDRADRRRAGVHRADRVRPGVLDARVLPPGERLRRRRPRRHDRRAAGRGGAARPPAADRATRRRRSTGPSRSC